MVPCSAFPPYAGCRTWPFPWTSWSSPCGYVVRVADPHDGRAKLVRLTPYARAIGDAADAEVARALGEWEEHLGPTRMRQLEEMMVWLREITDPWALTLTRPKLHADPPESFGRVSVLSRGEGQMS